MAPTAGLEPATHAYRVCGILAGEEIYLSPKFQGGTFAANSATSAKFTVMRTSLHRRIVAVPSSQARFVRLLALGGFTA